MIDPRLHDDREMRSGSRHKLLVGDPAGWVRAVSLVVMGACGGPGEDEVQRLPPVHAPEHADGQPESLTREQKRDLIAFLNRL